MYNGYTVFSRSLLKTVLFYIVMIINFAKAHNSYPLKGKALDPTAVNRDGVAVVLLVSDDQQLAPVS
jgi:hypothetical protein